MKAWNGWYHVNGNTYGTWLRGDPRGWRARHHREHVEGDYKKPPPPGKYDALLRQSRRLLRDEPVRLSIEQRMLAGQALVEMLLMQGVEVICLSLDAVHYHILARFANDDVRAPVGRAKKHAWHVLRDRGLKSRAWAIRCRVLPVRDRKHQVNIFNYIGRHAAKGAWVWTFRDGLHWKIEGAT